MYKEKKDFVYEIEEGFDYIIEEGQNTSINLRKISWNGRDPKLDLRKWSYSDGEERMLKGISFSNEGANELTAVLVERGYGDTKRIIKALSTRSDFNGIADISENNVVLEDDDSEEEYYDPNMLLA